ncbi:DUF3800 domain-containing protein [Desulfovirgula thermocuniculi]|uniref:DUF3800 domain-containing protein n=1 Tax=Desulfovirgula thermocuniculi TaxID=348842 RepID=UPI000A06DCE2|nr:DUF3800 domain-containing protein [Desulfovirgula thermocuniculi]
MRLKFKIYCDESRTNDPYKLVGGIWIKAEYGWPFVNDFHKICESKLNKIPAHMKWSNVPSKPESKYMCFYTDLVDLFFAYMNSGHMFFRVIVAHPNYRFDHPIYHRGDFEEGFYKLYYQLIYRTLLPFNEYHIRLAYRDVPKKVVAKDETTRLKELMNALNRSINRDYSYSLDELPVKSIASRPAEGRRLIQLADILIGATGYHWNNLHNRPCANKGKVFLASYIAGKLGRKDLVFTTSPNDRRFNIFFLNPK